MAEETEGVKSGIQPGDGSDSTVKASDETATPEPEDEVRFRLVESQDDPAAAKIPRERLNEVLAKQHAAETRVAELERHIRSAREPDNTEAKLRRPFGEGEEGDAALEAVKEVSTHTANQILENRIVELESRLEARVDAKLGGVTASLQSSEELAQMKSQGLIDDAAEKEISKRMSAMIANNPEWGKAGNQHHLLNEVYVGMQRGGEIKPQVIKPGFGGNSPMQPGTSGPAFGSSGQVSQQEVDAELRNTQKVFRNLQGLSIEKLRELDGGMTKQSLEQRQQRQQASPSRGSVAYTHTRG